MQKLPYQWVLQIWIALQFPALEIAEPTEEEKPVQVSPNSQFLPRSGSIKHDQQLKMNESANL